jgi:MoxR-like ATPase
MMEDEAAGPPERPAFGSTDEVAAMLKRTGYLADAAIAGAVYLGERLGKPVLIEGPAGTGKTELAKSVAVATGTRLIRLQCYEGLDESKALYEWDYRKQLLRMQSRPDAAQAWKEVESDLFSEDFLLTRPLLEAIRATEPVVLLIDEVDRLDVETEALLLEVLSDYQVSIPELGTMTARQVPLVFLTSNGSRELSEALKRRCLFLHLDYPTPEREREIVLSRVPAISEHLANQVTRVVHSLRGLDLKKHPSVSETLDWARTLLLIGVEDIEESHLRETMSVLLKYQSDIRRATTSLGDLARA